MKSFAPYFNLSVLNTNLKSGIWAGLTAVSAASGTLTVFAHWEDIEKKITSIYDYIEENYFEPVYDYFGNGVNALYTTFESWYETAQTYVDNTLDWISKNANIDQWLEGLGTVWEKSMEYLQTAFEFLKSMLNPESFTEKNIRGIIAAVTNIFKFAGEIIYQLLQQTEQAEKMFEQLKKLLQHEKIWEIIYHLGKVAFDYPEVLGQIEKSDMTFAFDYISYDADQFIANAEGLVESPIDSNQYQGNDLKEEIVKRLFTFPGGCRLEISFNAIGCIMDATAQRILNEVTQCKEGQECNEKEAGEFYKQTIKAVYEGLALDSVLKTSYEGLKS